PGERGERVEHEEEEGDAHRGELAPRPAQPAPQADARRRRRAGSLLLGVVHGPQALGAVAPPTTGTQPATRPCTQPAKCPHRPVTSARPTRTSSPPPTRMIVTRWRRRKVIARVVRE